MINVYHNQDHSLFHGKKRTELQEEVLEKCFLGLVPHIRFLKTFRAMLEKKILKMIMSIKAIRLLKK